MSDYDALIVGSGSGGLTAALALARAGQRVAVFEQHTRIGGYSQSFSLEGFQFSPGIHYIGQLQPGGRLRQIYEGLGVANELVFLELDPDGYDRVFVGQERFDIPKGSERFRERLREHFPSDASGIDRYFDLVQKISDELVWARPGGALHMALLPFRMRHALRAGLIPLERTLDRFVSDPFLRAILSIQSGDHGMAPSRAPTALHAGLQSYYFDGACYPRGGAQAIPNALASQIRRHGGEIFVGAEARQVLLESGRVAGLRLSDGREISAPVVVSNADPAVTWGQLVSPDVQSRRLRKRVARMRYSVSTLSLFLGVDMDLRGAGLDSGNIWYSRTTDIDAAYRAADTQDASTLDSIPALFLNVSTLKDPSLRSDGLHTVEALAVARSRAFSRWHHTSPGMRGGDYAALKQRLSDLMLEEIERFVPGFRDHVVFQSLATPLSNIHFLHASEGAIYGSEKTARNLGPLSLPVRTQVPGLFQCGASTLAPGINGVTKSGLAAAAAVLDCQEEELLTASGQNLRIYPSEAPESWPAEPQTPTRAA